jgi:hypothetical protein
MCDQMPPKGSDDTPADMPRPMVTVENLRRMARSYWRLRDPMLMASAWDEPATPEVQPATMSRSFGQLPSLTVPETFDDPLPDPESGAWEGDLPP